MTMEFDSAARSVVMMVVVKAERWVVEKVPSLVVWWAVV